ncbi:MAG TPA: bifunctional diguanylate cyclase/phosphodiesterase [Lachnospiraceae bacterium]|nr:bifunctional diguanylate cyclase/phosphodiesterase [Lachnospiraceae bacterium]
MAEATIINQELRPWEQYRNYFIVIGVVFVLLAIFVFILIIDNMKRRKIQKEISVLYQKYETAIYGTNSAVWELHLDSMTVETSRNFEEIFGKKIPYKGEMHEILEKLTDNDHGRQIIEAVQEYMKGEQTEINLRIPLADDREEQRWILIRGSGVYDLNGTLTDMTGIFLDITSEKVKENYIAYFAKHDFLTGLPNRMDFEETLQKELDAGNSGVLMLFDVDDFKSINDTLGHAFGDEILKQVADRLKNLCTGDRYVARMGGDEFLLILRNAKEKEDVLSCLEDINRVIADVFCYDEIEEYISFSAGITFYPKDNNNINQLMMNADAAMYRVKRSGKNNYQFYYEEMKRELKEKKEIETVLRQAVKEGTFELYYQPQVDAETGVINGFEALIRIKDFHVSPGVFIPIAEETGDIIEIGRWVAKEAISQMAEWKKKGFPEKRIAINYSAKQMRDKGYLSYVNQLLQEYEIDPQNIEIEITEGILLEKTEATMEFLKRIRSMGMRLALDDFGSGYSSLSYLTFIPVNKIKLDKSINDKFLDIDNMRVMESIISLAHSLELTITAEGIEDRDKFLKLKQCGCDMIQGYLFDRPMPAEKLEGIYNQVYGV